MSRNAEERVSRTQRHRLNLENYENENQHSRDLEDDLDAPRRRRSQAARMLADTDEPQDELPLSRGASASRRQFGSPQEQPRARRESGMPAQGNRRPGRKKLDAQDDFGEIDEIEEDEFDDDPREKSHLLRWVVICVVILALLTTATFVGLRNPDMIASVVQFGRDIIGSPTQAPTPEPTPTQTPEPTPEPPPPASAATVINFEANPQLQPDISQAITFRVTTTLQTDRVLIMDDNGQRLIERSESEYFTDTDDGRIWNLMYYFTDPYEGFVEVSPGNESGWNDQAGSAIRLSVGIVEEEPVAAVEEGEASGLSMAGAAAEVAVTGQIIVKKEVKDFFAREDSIRMGDVDLYGGESGMRGVLTFRGSNMRQNASFGTVTPSEKKLTSLWSATVGTASGSMPTWNVQPLIVQWHENIRKEMGLYEEKSKTAMKEVLFAGNDGRVYFLDLEDGVSTRDAMAMSYEKPMLGSASVYPSGYPVLFAAVGNPADAPKGESSGIHVNNLMSNKLFAMVRGENTAALSGDETFITTPLIDVNTDTMIVVGGNGILYTVTLNTQLNSETMELVMNQPSVDYYVANAGDRDSSVKSSLAIFGEQAFFASAGGVLQAVNLNTFKTDWAVDVGEETNAAIVAEADYGGGDTSLYTVTNGSGSGNAAARRINAQSGETIWSVFLPGRVTASPLIGNNGVARFVYIASDTALYALDKDTAEVIWQMPLNGSSTVTSPIALYDEQGTAYIIQGDTGGMYVLDGQTGEQLDFLTLEGSPIGSPAAFNEYIVVATNQGKLYGLMLQ